MRLVDCRHAELSAQRIFVVVVDEIDAVDRADIHARIALDTQLFGEHRLHIAVQAACRFGQRALLVEAQFHFQLEVLDRFFQVGVRHGHAAAGVIVILIRPLVDAHFLADQIVARSRALCNGFAVAERIDGNGGLMAVTDGPNDVLRPPRGVTAKEHLRVGRLERHLVDRGHAPLAERHAGIFLDPRKRVVLADGHQHVVALDRHHLA